MFFICHKNVGLHFVHSAAAYIECFLLIIFVKVVAFLCLNVQHRSRAWVKLIALAEICCILFALVNSTSSKMPDEPRMNYFDCERIVDAYENGEDFIALAATLNIKKTTAYTIIRLYQTTGRVETLPTGGGRS